MIFLSGRCKEEQRTTQGEEVPEMRMCNQKLKWIAVICKASKTIVWGFLNK